MSNQSPAEALRQDINNILKQTGATITVEGRELTVITPDTLTALTAYAATVEREALKALRAKMTIFPPNGVYEASMFAVTVNDIDDRLAALQRPRDETKDQSDTSASK